MKKFALFFLLLVCGIAFSSCEDKKEDESGYHTDGVDPDTSLAGSVFMSRYFMREVEGSYNGVAFSDLNSNRSIIDVWKVSNTEICLYVEPTWGETTFVIAIPVIPLTGKPYDVAFDTTSDKAKLEYNGSRYDVTTATVKGWIRERSVKLPKSPDTRDSPPLKEYKCEIEVACMIDGKPLNLKITSVEPF